MTNGYLYVIKDGRYKSRWVKVGKTVNPANRLNSYNGSFPDEIMYYSYVSELLFDCDKAESELLEWLNKRKRTEKKKNEWFRAVSYHERFIRSIINKIEEITDKYYTEESSGEYI